MTYSNLDHSVDCYHEALALNNEATANLQRGRYKEALKASTRSIRLMQKCFVTGESEKECERLSSRKLSSKKEKNGRKQSKDGNVPAHLTVDVVVLEHSDLHDLRSAVHYGPSNSVVFPVRTGSSDEADKNDEAAATAMFGIILYNHGLINFLVFQDMVTDVRGRTTLDSVHKKATKCVSQTYSSLKMAQTSLRSAASLVADKKRKGWILLLSDLCSNLRNSTFNSYQRKQQFCDNAPIKSQADKRCIGVHNIETKDEDIDISRHSNVALVA